MNSDILVMLYTLFVVYYLWGGVLFVCLFTLSQYVTLADLELVDQAGLKFGKICKPASQEFWDGSYVAPHQGQYFFFP